ncbi:MAG: ACP S-malonyltransferase [Desulfobulbales bacterium]
MQKQAIAILFPGQGSQYIGMGREFLETDAEASGLMDLAESISGASLRKLCLEGPMEELTRAECLQPALTAVNLICWQAVSKAGIKADYLAGHSLGEYSALCAAGVLTVEDTLKLVTERGRFSDREGVKNPGSMQAVLGLPLEEVEEILQQLSGDAVVTVANHNTELQIVISGEKAALHEAEKLVGARGGRAITLNVSIANHSPLIAGAVPDFTRVLNSTPFNPPRIPVLFNVTAAAEQEPDVIRAIMARQLVSRVRWYEIINALLAQNVRIFIEVGPKTVLSGLVKKIVPKELNCRIFQVDTPESLEKCVKEVQSLI